MSSSTTTLLRARWLISSARLQVAFQRLRLSLRAYRVDQPRVPAGHLDGGQWTDGDAGDGYDSDDDARIVHVSDDADRRYTVLLSEEEVHGRHTLREHVGKTDAQMLARVQASKRRFPFLDYGLRRDGSFESVAAANDFVNRTLEENASEVDDVATGTKDRAFLTSRSGTKPGGKPTRRGSLSRTCVRPTALECTSCTNRTAPTGTASILRTRATTEIEMQASPEFLTLGRWCIQDIDRIAPTHDEMYDFVLKDFSGEERVRLRQFIDQALREASDETLERLWNKTEADIYFPTAQDLRGFLTGARDRL